MGLIDKWASAAGGVSSDDRLFITAMATLIGGFLSVGAVGFILEEGFVAFAIVIGIVIGGFVAVVVGFRVMEWLLFTLPLKLQELRGDDDG